MVGSILAYDPTAGINSLKKFDHSNNESAKKAKLKAACQEFEAVLTSIILKEGMQTAKKMGEEEGSPDRDNGGQMYMDMAHEQMAYYVGKNGMLGLGETIYNSLESRMGEKTQQPVQGEIKK